MQRRRLERCVTGCSNRPAYRSAVFGGERSSSSLGHSTSSLSLREGVHCSSSMGMSSSTLPCSRLGYTAKSEGGSSSPDSFLRHTASMLDRPLSLYRLHSPSERLGWHDTKQKSMGGSHASELCPASTGISHPPHHSDTQRENRCRRIEQARQTREMCSMEVTDLVESPFAYDVPTRYARTTFLDTSHITIPDPCSGHDVVDRGERKCSMLKSGETFATCDKDMKLKRDQVRIHRRCLNEARVSETYAREHEENQLRDERRVLGKSQQRLRYMKAIADIDSFRSGTHSHEPSSPESLSHSSISGSSPSQFVVSVAPKQPPNRANVNDHRTPVS